MKSAIVITGRHEATAERYQGIINYLLSSGWQDPVLYQPDWSRRSISDLVDDFLKITDVSDPRPLTVIGFSLGGMIALIASNMQPIESLILCSPSGYFKEYARLLTSDDLVWAQKHLQDFKDYSAHTVIDESNVKHGFVIAGENELAEWRDFKVWINDLRSQTRWTYREVAGVGHEIEAAGYQSRIKQIVQEIR